jgi:7-cyano-7-deazaguanine reductase
MGDFRHLKGHGTKYPDRIAPELLDTFANPHPERSYEIRFTTREVTSLCPVTGQPDFYSISITYIPRNLCIESKSLKLYLFSFRNSGLFAEDMANRILADCVTACDPEWLEVVCRMNPRGGITLRVVVYHGVRPH